LQPDWAQQCLTQAAASWSEQQCVGQVFERNSLFEQLRGESLKRLIGGSLMMKLQLTGSAEGIAIVTLTKRMRYLNSCMAGVREDTRLTTQRVFLFIKDNKLLTKWVVSLRIVKVKGVDCFIETLAGFFPPDLIFASENGPNELIRTKGRGGRIVYF
jgi:hypothetical protein